MVSAFVARLPLMFPVAFILKFKVHSDVLFPLQLGKVYGIESHVLSPAETKDLYPLMNVDDLYGTLYVPKDGTMDPAGTCTTLSRAASARGAKVGRRNCSATDVGSVGDVTLSPPDQVIENCPVTGVQVRTDDLGVKRVKAVETPHGTIETPCVVNCAGPWSRSKKSSFIFVVFNLCCLTFMQASGPPSWGTWPV